MPRFFKGFIFAIIATVGFLGCTATEQTTEPRPETTTGIYPEWYVQSGFEADSLTFEGFATAVSSDSSIAMANAELQARANLESHIASRLEAVREELEDNAEEVASDTDFIITLRNAHNRVQEAADSGNRSAKKEEDYYRGFAQVSITKGELRDILESGFTGKSSYWQLLRSSDFFQEELQ